MIHTTAKYRTVKFLIVVSFFFVYSLFAIAVEGKDLYKVLEVEKDANERDIKKAFHRLSLKYHPDKNPSKSAEKKFQELSNAYEVLSDSEKRKQYDNFGEGGQRQGGPSGFHHGGSDGFPEGGSGFSRGGFSRFYQSEAAGFPFDSFFGGGPRRKTQFQFNFGGFGGENQRRGLFDNIFSSFKGRQSDSTSKNQDLWKGLQGVEHLTGKNFNSRVLEDLEDDHWLVLFVEVSASQLASAKPIIEHAGKELRGLVKVGAVNCATDPSLCSSFGAEKFSALLFLANARSRPVMYPGELSKSSLVKWVMAQLPNYSIALTEATYRKRIGTRPELPRAVLFTSKSSTPAMWQALSAVFKDRVLLLHTQVVGKTSLSGMAQKHKVSVVPSVMGYLATGEQVIYSGEAKREAIQSWLEKLEERSLASSGSKKHSAHSNVPFLHQLTESEICGSHITACILVAVKSKSNVHNAKRWLHNIPKSNFSRRGGNSKNALHFGIVNVLSQKSIMTAFVDTVKEWPYKEEFVVAYKPKRATFAVMEGEVTENNIITFVEGVLNGNLSFKKTRRNFLLQ